MWIALLTHFDSLILIFGGVLIFILGFVFYQLAFLQKTGTGIAIPSSKNLAKNQKEMPAKREKEATISREQVRSVKPGGEPPVQQQKQAPKKLQKEKSEKQQNDGSSSFFKRLFNTTRKGNQPDAEAVGAGASSRMPKLSSLGIKDGKPNNEKSDAEAKAMVKDMDLNSSPNLTAGTDVISAMAAVSSQGVTITNPNDVTIVPSVPEIAPVPAPPVVPVAVASPPVSPPAVTPPPVPSTPKEEKKEEKSDRMKNMFDSEDIEESESNKVAKDLEQVDIQDLLTESQTLINSFVRCGN